MAVSNPSLRWKLCWLLVATAVLTVAAFGLVAYLAARKTILEATNARLQSAVSQLNTLTAVSVTNQIELLRSVARDPAVIDALQHPAAPVTPATIAALRRLLAGNNAANGGAVDLVLPDATVIYATDAGDDGRASRPPLVIPETATIGPLFEAGETQAFEEAAPVLVAQRTIGGVRLTRKIGSAATRRVLSSLLGEKSEFLIGNQHGALWGESGKVMYPPQPEPSLVYQRNGRRWVSASMPLRDTPWLMAVEIPESVALSPARALFLPFLGTGAVIALAGVLVGLRVSNRITSPLADLTAATEAIARGERDITINGSDREDEIGRLARSFGSMAASVRAVRDRLESEVDARTGELGEAVEGLRKLDEELRQSERFAAIGRLSGNVSHELRNPLGVMSMVTLLLDGMPDASPKVKDYVSLLREQIRLSERIISDLLDRARAGATVPVRSEVDVLGLLESLLGRAEIPSTVTVRRDFPPALPALRLDRDHVGQIVWNLMTNAVQAMHGTGTLTVGAAVSNGRLRISVRDSGPGISATHAEKIFEPLFTTKAEGVGLGLAISRSFARSNGGDLRVENAGQAGGACFVLELPATPAHGADARAQRGDSASSSVSAS